MDQSAKVRQQIIESIKGLGLQEDQVDIRIHYALDSYRVAITVDPEWKGYINQVATQVTNNLTIDFEDEHLKGFEAVVRVSQLKDGKIILDSVH